MTWRKCAMHNRPNRRRFLQTAIAGGVAAGLTAGRTAHGAGEASGRSGKNRGVLPSNLIFNDDGYNFLCTNDDLHKEDLRRYIESYCRGGVGAVAYYVGSMSLATFYPTRVGTHYSAARTGEMARVYRNLDNFASEPGGYFGTAFRIIRGTGKKALASFRMNDVHVTSLDNPNASVFWKQHAKMSLGPEYGYYGGCLNYGFDAVRSHFAGAGQGVRRTLPGD